MKWRTLQPITTIQVAGVSHILGTCKGVSHRLEICTTNEKKATTRLSPIGYWSKSSSVGWYFGIGQGSSKISHTCNRLIID